MRKSEYIPALDGLRCFAVALVFLFHGEPSLFSGGWLGVDLFFVLSGYLITGLLVAEIDQTGRLHLGRFYLRRALRLLPALIAAVLFAGFLWPDGYHSPFRIDWLPSAGYVMAYAANLVWGEYLGSLNHCWSLAVEEHYYLIWPPLFLLVWRIGGRKGAVATALAGIVAIFYFRRVGVEFLLSHGIEAYRCTLTRADSLLIGSATALLFPRSGDSRSPVASAALGLGLGFGAFLLFFFDFARWADWLNRGGYDVLAAGSAVLVVAATRDSSVARILSASPLVWVGKRSYGIYLYHLPIFHVTQAMRVPGDYRNLIWVMGLRIATTLVVAELSYRLLECPFLALKGRIARGAGSAETPAHSILVGMHKSRRPIEVNRED